MTTFDARRSAGYDRRASRLLHGLHRRIAADTADATAPGGTVLDIGTGPGRLLAELAARRPELRLHGADLSPHMIDLARRRVDGAELVVADVAELPFPDGAFDTVVSSLSMHEWPDLPAAARELRRVLRPQGRLMVYDFRFARARAARAALGDRFATVTVTPVRPRRHPVALVTRYTAEP
ncbi:class I SAM-dependent methyltransferase [Nocardia thailandica]